MDDHGRLFLNRMPVTPDELKQALAARFLADGRQAAPRREANMDLSVISTEPHASSTAILLAMLGIVAFFLLRRWRVTIVVIGPVLAYLTWDLLRKLVPMAASLARPEVRAYLVSEFGVCIAGLCIGIGLPVLAWRRASRPAAFR
jgi:hypothetical protein